MTESLYSRRPLLNKDTAVCISLAARPSNIGTRFHNYLYDEVGILHGAHVGRAFDSAHDGCFVICGHLAFFDGLGEEFIDILDPAFDEPVLDVSQDDIVARH